MTLISVERIKLFSTRSPYWCLGSIVLVSVLFALLVGLINNGEAAIPFFALRGVALSLDIFLVLAALSVTTEYRFGTVRSTFLAAPKRVSVLLAKTVLLAVIGGAVGLVCAMGAFFLAKALARNPPFPLELTGSTWRQTAGYAALFAVGAVISVAVGTLLRQSAGAIALLLLWPIVFEPLFTIIPTVGPKVGPWLPFAAADKFITPTTDLGDLANAIRPGGPTPVQGLLVFVGTGILLWLAAAFVVTKRDA